MKSELSEYCKTMSPNKSKRTEKVTKITIHHMAGSLTAAQCESIFANPRRCASANYLIGKDGEILCNVDEDYRAWTSGSNWNDQRAITIEVANSTGKPNWEISEKVMQSLILLCADICRRYCIVPYFTNDKNGSMTFHYMYQATECPGPYIRKNIKFIIDSINNELCFIEKPVEKPKSDFQPYKVKVTANCLNIRKEPNAKSKKVGEITDKGVYTIVEEKEGWGKLKSGAGWISLKYVKGV